MHQQRIWSIAVFTAALIGSLVIYRDLWADPIHTTLGSVDHINDPMQMMWFLKWTPWQLLHGGNPFFSTNVFWPKGVSLAWNTLTPTLGILAAPITFTLGPELSFAVLMTIAPALTAVTGFWWLRRHTGHPAAAALGSMLVAFNPFVAGHMLGHLNLVFTGLVPLILMLLEDLWWRRPRPQLRTAVLLGSVSALQMGISEELLLIAAIAVLIALAVALCLTRRALWEMIRTALPWSLAALGVFLLVSSPLLVNQLLLAPEVVVNGAGSHAVPAGYLFPTTRQLVRWAPGSHQSLPGGAENGVYLGILMMLTLGCGIILTVRRDRLVRLASVVLASTALLTFGANGLGSSWLPWRLLAGIPGVESILPGRFAFASFLVIAWLLGRWADSLITEIGSRHESGSTAARVPLLGLTALVSAVVSLFPAGVSSYPLPAPVAFFDLPSTRAVLPNGTAVLFLPAGDGISMYYQQRADFAFVMPAGYALLPPDDPAATGATRTLVALSNEAQHPTGRLSLRPQVDGRVALCHSGVAGIVVVDADPARAGLVALATALAGRPADVQEGGVSFWHLSGADCRPAR